MPDCTYVDAARRAADDASYLLLVAKLQRALHDLVDADVGELIQLANIDTLWSFEGYGLRDRGMRKALANARAAVDHLKVVREELQYLQRFDDFEPRAQGSLLPDEERELIRLVHDRSRGCLTSKKTGGKL